MVIYHRTRPHIAVLGKLSGTNVYRNINRFPDAEEEQDKLIVRFDSMLYFANAEYFKERLQRLEGKKKTFLRLVIIDAVGMTSIDTSGIHALREVIEEHQERNIALYLSGVIGLVRDVLHRTGITDRLGKDHFFIDINEALAYYVEPEKSKANPTYILQTNP